MIQEEFIKMKEKLKKKYKKIKAGKKEWYLVIFIVVITTFYGYYLELSLLFVFFFNELVTDPYGCKILQVLTS